MNTVATAIKTQRSIYTYRCQVMNIIPLSVNTFQIELQSPAGTMLDYYAGQYLQIDLDLNSDLHIKNDTQSHPLFYSIANKFNPEKPRRLVIFIQNSSEFVAAILKKFSQLSENKAEIQVTLPMGRAYLQTDLSLTHLLIAAGSGISKIKCLTEEILKQQPDADVNIYWSNKNADEFYLLDEFQAWVDKHNNLNFIPLLESANETWLGRSGYIYELLERDFKDLNSVQTYLCGSPKMVYGTIDKLKSIGLKEDNCYSDVFEYAARK